MKFIHYLLLLLLLPTVAAVAQQSYYFPAVIPFDSRIPTPAQFLGYPIGSHYTRHDRIIDYFRELARLSDRVHIQETGQTYEARTQLIATITAPEQYAQLEQVRRDHLTQLVPDQPPLDARRSPVIVLLGYSVHGNETSSGETAMLTAYYLAAAQDTATLRWLREAVIFIDPSLNPDGRDRAANWHNAYKSLPPVGDPADKEHVEGWPNGRSNHYLANLNRDWLSATQVESRNRLAFFHQWYPNVQIDFHEMGAGSTYYFEPSPARAQSPLLPASSYAFNARLAKYHAEALDQAGSLYFTKELFDNLSPIYGSTYPDFYGAVGVTFEQGGSRGLVQETENGPLTFAFTIRNHLLTGLATIRAAVTEKAALLQLQKDFFRSALQQGVAYSAKGYVFGDEGDASLTRAFLQLLLLHKIQVYTLSGDVLAGGKTFKKGSSYIVPSAQPQFRIIHSIFDETPPLKDSVYYDNTSWSLIHAYGLSYAKLSGGANPKGALVSAVTAPAVTASQANYAYLLPWSEYNASRALYYLQEKGIRVKAAFKPFRIATTTGVQNFGYGSLVIPVAGQEVSRDSLYKAVQAAAYLSELSFYSTNTGFSEDGIDLGSNNIRTLRKPQAAVIFGAGTNYEEAGQVWFLLNQHLQLPVSKIDIAQLPRLSLQRYNTLILVSGNYQSLNKETISRLHSWVSEGGTLITFKDAAEWAIKEGLSKEQLWSDSAGKAAVIQRVDYADQEGYESAARINGGIFRADIDITHPIAFGLNNRAIYFTKNSQTILQPSRNKYSTIARYNNQPYVSGYVSKGNIAKISQTAAILISQLGNGRVVLFADDPTYRSYWHGTDRLLINALFFARYVQLQPTSF